MPIDPNIALGVRPIEQPNVLGQMAQMMAMRQAQQGYESENALRDFYSKGGDATTAEGRRALMAASPTAGIKLIGQQSEIAARDLGSTEKAIKLYKDQVGGVTDPASAASLLTAVYKNPLTRPFVESMAPLDKALAAIPTDPSALEQWKRGFGLTADKLFVDANTMATNQARIQAAGIGAAPGLQQAETARQRLKMDQGGTWASVIVGDRVMEHNNRTGEWREASVPESTGGTVSVLPPTTLPLATGGGGAALGVAPQTAPTNALAPQPAGAAPVVNALVQPPAAATPAPARQPLTTFNPKKVVKETTNAAGDVTQYNERGEVVGVVHKAGKPSAANEKEQAALQKVPEAIAMNKDAIRKIDEILAHPGLQKATGMGGGAMRFFSGTEAKNFEIRHNEVLSQAFLDAFEALKGGGAITEKEGEKATAARTRMDLAQSADEYKIAAKEYQGVLRRGIANAERRMSQGSSAPTAGAPEDPLGIR